MKKRPQPKFDPARSLQFGNQVLKIVLALFFFLLPTLTLLRDLADPALRNGQIPQSAWRLFKDLTPRYEKWARVRVFSGSAGDLTGANISGTEWPPFGSGFYLWAVESLQQAWDEGDHSMAVAPKVFARGAIEASTELIHDPATAGWVRRYWGPAYAHQEDIFYRMLLISSATVYQDLTGDAKYLPVLRDQVETLAAEVDKSPYGLLDDYPRQCWPADVVAGVAAIRRADHLLGTDHSKFVERSKRGFVGDLADRGQPPYMADSKKGEKWGPARGCSNSYQCLFAPLAWPSLGAQWYADYEKYFWQEKWGGAGFREFPNDLPKANWYWDVDSGPVVAGHGISACAFGLGAARLNGRLDHALPLATETLAFGWTLPDGTLLLPRILSDASDAPLVGEASILFNLTRRPLAGVELRTGGSIPPVVWVWSLLLFGAGALLAGWGVRGLRNWKNGLLDRKPDYPAWHFAVWVGLVLAVPCFLATGHYVWACWPAVTALFFPLEIRAPRFIR